MTGKRSSPQFDLFVPFTTDLPFRDTQETMERPFFSLAKRKRLKPIEYTSPDGTVFVKVFATPQFGMATIWDADVLIWAASTLNAMRKRGTNDLPRTLRFQPYDVLKTIGRDSGGRDYKLLKDALGRLQSTTVTTNIRPVGRKKERQFSWIESWSDEVDEATGQSRGMTLTVSEWLFEGILMEGNLLSIDSDYFGISGGRERWLYRVARKHAGGHGPEGFAISLPTLFEKSGAEGTYRRFKFEMLALAGRCQLPGFDIFLEAGQGKEPSLRMIKRDAEARPRVPSKAVSAKLAQTPHLTDETLSIVRRKFPGWDVHSLKIDYDAYICGDDARQPEDYQKGFYGFVKMIDQRGGL